MKMWSRVGDKTQKRRRALTLAQRCHGPAFDFEDNEEMAGNSTFKSFTSCQQRSNRGCKCVQHRVCGSRVTERVKELGSTEPREEARGGGKEFVPSLACASHCQTINAKSGVITLGGAYKTFNRCLYLPPILILTPCYNLEQLSLADIRTFYPLDWFLFDQSFSQPRRTPLRNLHNIGIG